MIRVENLVKIVPEGEQELTILNNISLNVAQSQSLAITGASGSGKSTLLGLLAGLDVPTSGNVYLNDHCITQLDEEGRAAVRAELVGFVFQSFQLLPALSAMENVALPLELRGEKKAEQMAMDFLERVGLTERSTHQPRHLSGGEQQRVAIARAFACQPQILFADEPTGNLDTRTGKKVSDLIFDLNREHGTTLVLVTHDLTLAARCGEQFVLEAGEQVTPHHVESALVS